MVTFHSYVSLPEGKSSFSYGFFLLAQQFIMMTVSFSPCLIPGNVLQPGASNDPNQEGEGFGHDDPNVTSGKLT